MNGKKVSAALNALPEEMVAEAMEPGHRGRGVSWLRLAACVAIIVGLFFGFWPTEPEIVTAPGLLTVTVYARDEDGQGYIVTEIGKGVDAARKQENECVIDGVPMDPIGISVYFDMDTEEFPTEEIIYNVKVERGMYFDYSSGDYIQGLGTEFTRQNPSFASWAPVYVTDDDPNADNYPEYDHVYTEIIIYCESHIVGYTIMRFDRIYNEFGATTNYDPYIVASVLFPKLNGEYQNIAKKYVDECIRTVKDNDLI